MSGIFATVAESLKGDFALRLVFLWAHPFRTRIRTQQPCPQWFRADLGTGRPGLQVSEITELCNDNQGAATRKRLTLDCVLVHGGFESFRCNGICWTQCIFMHLYAPLRILNLYMRPNTLCQACFRHGGWIPKGDFALRLVFLWAHLFLTLIRTQQPCPHAFRADLGRGRPGRYVWNHSYDLTMVDKTTSVKNFLNKLNNYRWWFHSYLLFSPRKLGKISNPFWGWGTNHQNPAKVMATPQGDPTVLVLEFDGGKIEWYANCI